MIDPWIALAVNMLMIGALGALWQRNICTHGFWQDYAAAVFIFAIVGGAAAALAWGLTLALPT